MDEAAAIHAYQRGHTEAFAVLFELHAAHVYRTAYLITRDVGRAEDIAQETFLVLAQRLPGLAAGPLRSWLGRVAANLSLNERRRAWALPLEALSSAQQEALELRTALPGADVEALAREERRRVQTAVAALAPRQRAMLVLRYYGDCSMEEIAVALGCRPGTVRATVHQALRRLRVRSDLRASLQSEAGERRDEQCLLVGQGERDSYEDA